MSETGRAWIELNRNHLRHNITLLRNILPAKCELMPAVKANAYGHGATLIAKELNQLGIHTFCVACISEGIQLRENGITGDILILGYTAPSDFPLLSTYHLMQTVVDFSYAKQLNAYGKPLKVHLKIDTGMHRLGEWYQHTDNIRHVFLYKNLTVTGMYTHLCVVDDPSKKEYTDQQIYHFYELVRKLKHAGIAIPKLHIQSSYGVLQRPDLQCDYARIGIAMYGVFSTALAQPMLALRPVLSVKARVETIKTLSAGESTGYGLHFTAQRKTVIAVIAIGYADGIPRSLSCNVGSVLLHGKKVPIVGRICMDQLTVDITAVPNISAGDIATIIGQDHNAEISVCDIAGQTASISNEVLSRLGTRLTRLVV